jgi:hypothetical protein
MKVLDLQCGQQHAFEGWFGSEEDFQSQLARSLVQCPMCGNSDITKKLSAPRFNLGKSAAPSAEVAAESKNPSKNPSKNTSTPETNSQTTATSTELAVKSPASSQTQQVAQRPNLPPEVAEAMQAAWLEVAKHVMANTEDVGSSFASEARKIHYGEADERAIRGQATPDQTMELLEEGIDVMPMPIPESLKRPLN